MEDETADTTPPVVSLNGDAEVTVECHGTYDELGATATDDTDGAVSVDISGSVDVNAPGDYTITYSATDAAGNSASETRTVHVVDSTAPSVSFALSTTTLWPPDHRMVVVASGVGASDVCGSADVSISVTSNEAENGTGDGDTTPDWDIGDNGDGTFDVAVRAERAGNGSGRIYTITVTGTDGAGNSSSISGEVTVPHSQNKGKGKK